MTGATSFGDRLAGAFRTSGRLCVGIDPHEELLDHWGLDVSAVGAREFGLRVVEAAAGVCGIVKPQVAFYERFGAAGYSALERVLAEARDAGLLIIGDVKRGDIGSSVAAYGAAWLTPGAPLEVDSITLSPYLGLGSLEGVLGVAEASGKGVFVLAATSNPEASALQRSVLQQSSQAGATVAGAMTAGIAAWNASQPDAATREYGAMGVVIGATVNLREQGIDSNTEPAGPTMPVLAPGFGFQGAQPKDRKSIFGAYARGVIVSESRSVLGAGRDGVADEIKRRVDELGSADD
ncbi:MAG TPA: orotidine-5'-phosphate decarboxylase [Candidatus Lumbricidophila sp.]|nr:orotidine-5'-phosphate decarboxylase [Candidatus Lumbricidophila sp.]